MNNKNKEFSKGMGLFGLYLFVIPVISFYVSRYASFEGIIPFIVRFLPLNSFWHDNILSLLGEILGFMIIAFIYRKVLIDDFKKLKTDFKRIFKISIKYWLMGLIIMIISNFIINYVIFEGSIAANEAANRELIIKLPIYAGASLILLAPITEELIFRQGFKKAFSKKWLFVIFSTLFFASIHLMASFTNLADAANNLYQLWYLIPYGGLGLAFSLAFIESDNIYASIIIHIIQNVLSLSIILLSM